MQPVRDTKTLCGIVNSKHQQGLKKPLPQSMTSAELTD